MNRKIKQLGPIGALAILFILPIAAKADPVTLALPGSVTVQAGGEHYGYWNHCQRRCSCL